MEDLQELSRIYKIHDEAKFDAIKKHCREYWYEYFKEYPQDIKLAGVTNYLETRYKQNREKIYLVTINPIEGTDIVRFIKKIEKCLKKKWIKHWMWCMEWRDMDKGMHAHIRIEANKPKKPSEVRRECYNTFKDLVGNVQCVDVRFGRREDAYVEYIQGIKEGKKKPNYEHDTKLRKHFKISEFYMG